MTKEQEKELEKLAEENERLKYNWAELKGRIEWLTAANAFHKKAAEEAIEEQYRLQNKCIAFVNALEAERIKSLELRTENATLLEVIQEQERANDILIAKLKSFGVSI